GRDFCTPEGSTDRACSSTMMRRSPMEMRSPCRNGAARTGCPFRYSGAAVVARRTTPSAPLSMTACVGATLGESSSRSAAALPRRIRSAWNARELFSLPPSYTLRTIGIIASPRCSAAREWSGQRAIDERATHAQKARLGDLPRRLDQLAVRARDPPADVVFPEVEDG